MLLYAEYNLSMYKQRNCQPLNRKTSIHKNSIEDSDFLAYMPYGIYLYESL